MSLAGKRLCCKSGRCSGPEIEEMRQLTAVRCSGGVAMG